MAFFDISRQWVIFFPPDVPEAGKAASDLARYIDQLAALAGSTNQKPTVLTNAYGSDGTEISPVITLESEGGGPYRNGFFWRAGPERVEIFGESGRGLCNGIYSFLSSLGISWPAPGQERFPSPSANNTQGFPFTINSASEPSRYKGNDPAAAPLRRFVPAGKKEVKLSLKKPDAFAAWAARRRYDSLIFPLSAFASAHKRRKLKELKKFSGEYGISLEAGGRDLSSLVPRRYFLFHKDYFRMEEGRRTKAHHFCPTNPGTIKLISKQGKKLFRKAGEAEIFHLWPDKGGENAWCSCPSCRAFLPHEQHRIGVNAAADILAITNPDRFIVFYEKPGEGGSIPLRKNVLRMEKLPDEKEFGP